MYKNPNCRIVHRTVWHYFNIWLICIKHLFRYPILMPDYSIQLWVPSNKVHIKQSPDLTIQPPYTITGDMTTHQILSSDLYDQPQTCCSTCLPGLDSIFCPKTELYLGLLVLTHYFFINFFFNKKQLDDDSIFRHQILSQTQ